MRNILRLLSLSLAFAAPALVWADDPKPDRSGEDRPEKFVPLHPRSTEDQERVEALRLYATARSLEDRHKLGEAIEALEKARKLAPDSPAILRRLSKLNMVLGRLDAAVASARQLLEVDPSDSASITLLVAYYLERKNNAEAAESILRKVAENPKLDKDSAGYLIVLRTLGDLYADALGRPADAADAYAKLMEALDAPSANKLSPRDRARVFDGDEPTLYLRIGDALLKADRPADAAKAFRRGLEYDPEHPILPRRLARALLSAKQPDQALATLEPHLKRQPAGVEDYELLVEVLEAAGKADEILPRIEAAAKADPKNLRLQFFLAERYQAAGQGAKSEAMLADLLKDQADPQVYAALADSYKRAKKADALVKLLGEALERPGGIEALRPTLEAVSRDPEMAGRLLDAGLAMMEAEPPTLTPKARQVLAIVALQAKLGAKVVAIDRAAAKADPSAANLRQLADDLFNAQEFDASADARADLIAKFPEEKTPISLLLLAQGRFFGGKVAAAVEAAEEARRLDANNPETLRFLGYLLSQAGRDDDAIAVYQDMLARYPNEKDVVKAARSGLSVCYVNKGDLPQGEAELEILYRKDPEDPGVNNDLGYLYADQGKNLEKAEVMIRKALEEEPENSSYLDSLGWVLFKQGKAKEAIEPLERAAKARVDVTICEHLGDVFFRLKDFAKASASWTQARELAEKATPPDKRLAEIKRKIEEISKLNPGAKSSDGEGP